MNLAGRWYLDFFRLNTTLLFFALFCCQLQEPEQSRPFPISGTADTLV
jgi:hypothetical protein